MIISWTPRASFAQYSKARKLEHRVLSVAVGVQGTGPITTFQIDCSESSPTITTLKTISADNLTALSSGSLENAFVVFAGDGEGRVQCFDTVKGSPLKVYAPAAFPVERITVGEAAGRLVVAVTVQKQNDVARISIWDVAAGTLLRTTGRTAPNDDRAYGVARAVQLAGGVHFLVAQTEGVGRLQLFDPLLTAFRPPECFLITTVADIVDPTPPLTIRYTESAGNTHTQKDVHFEPWLIMTDRNDPSVEYRSKLKSILMIDPRVPTTNGKYVLTFAPPDDTSSDAQLRWERAGSLRIAWLSVGDIEGQVLEAPFNAPLADKQVKPVPYSTVAPKIAAVVLADDVTSPTPSEIWEKTALFGDAATAQGGAPALRANGSQFAYEAVDQETFDVPMTEQSGASKINLMLIKYLANGQAIATGAEVTP